MVHPGDQPTAASSDAGASELRACPLTGSRGTILAKIGDTFRDIWGSAGYATWEIVSFTGHRTYSPSGLGGTPIVRCRVIDGQMPPEWLAYRDEGGAVEWCGDSVASLLLAGTNPTPTQDIEAALAARKLEERP